MARDAEIVSLFLRTPTMCTTNKHFSSVWRGKEGEAVENTEKWSGKKSMSIFRV